MSPPAFDEVAVSPPAFQDEVPAVIVESPPAFSEDAPAVVDVPPAFQADGAAAVSPVPAFLVGFKNPSNHLDAPQQSSFL